ncbi:RNA binding protein [Plasmodium coatneyi]|uniref:RNA binding protein n=1 Tax=Plasmodium coatneyi TaxID=208452 RepID=A0A1B1E1J7_9APIC|nr:RNA binding protein [Plasmodium coatneyi]ANQ08916.1 RNA binding protein [Plasmodium coatneyi]
MSLNFSIANVVYVKNLSTDVTEKDIKEKFESCDEIIGVVFKNFPGKNQKYCQIEFKSSEGITKASRLNGELLLNVPMVVTVIEPISHNPPFSDPAIGNNETDKNLATSLDARTGALVNTATAQALQNILLQQQLLSEQKKGLVDFQNSLNEKNNKFDVFSKIIYMENVPPNCSEDDIKALFKNVGTTTSYKLHYNEQKKVHTAFVEFTNEEHAKAALHLNGTKIGTNEIIIRDACSLINERDNLKNNFSFYSNGTSVTNTKGDVSDPPPVKKPPVVNEKVEKVLALREKLSQKLFALYNSSAAVANNLAQVNPQLTGVPAEGVPGVTAGITVGVNRAATSTISAVPNTEQPKTVAESNNVSEAKEKKKAKEEGENTDEDATQDKVRKGKKSRSGKYSSSESSSSSRSSSYTSSSSRSSYRRHGSKTKSRRKRSHKRRSSDTRKRDKYDSRSRSNDSSSSYESHKRSRYRDRESEIRRTRKRYHSSSVSCSNSSDSPRRRRKRSTSNKPWWVKESEKMEMRQRLKERQRREMAYRERYRR